MGELVSVIIPVYNLGEFISKSLPSVLNQTFVNLDILLIDDGSNDNTLELCKQLAEKDQRIRVIHQANGGVSAARNTGIENARGDYIAFVDGDDIIAPFYIEKLLEAVRGNVLSMCLHERVRSYEYHFPDTREAFGTFPADECAKRVICGNFPVSVWGGVFYRSLIADLRFPVGIRQNEDKYFLYSYLLRNRAGMVAFSNEKMYGYFVREGSVTQSAWNGSRDTIIMADAMHGLTMQLHPDWKELSKANQIGVRLGVLKSILMSGSMTREGREAYRQIKAQAISLGPLRKGGKSLKAEYICLRLSDPLYKAIVRMYYRFMSDQRRYKRNEKVTRQF